MFRALLKVFDGYGSFFGLRHPLSRLLLVACTMLHPLTGLSGLGCAALVVLTRYLLSFPAEGGELEIVNGLLFGMLIGSLYAPCGASLVVLSLAAVLIVLLTACLTDTLGKICRLPVLGLPYVITGYIMLPLAPHLGMTPLLAAPGLVSLPALAESPLNLLAPLGSLYFNGTAWGGIIVFLAFALSSRYLALLTLGASIVCTLFLHYGYFDNQSSGLGLLSANPLPLLIAQMNGVLSAGVIGGLYTVPSPRSIMVAMASAILACLLTLLFEHTFWSSTFPPLALPFVLATYIVLLALSAARGGPWLRFWLFTPALPEASLERLMIGRARGVDLHSVALRCPVSGSWKVYQGFDGDYTHKGPWRYALDLIQTVDGKSYKEDGNTLTEYYSYCKPVLSPGWGTVVALTNTCADNQPGDVELVENWGNYLLIRLDNGPYVMLAHLQRGSIRVNVHSRVEPGQLLALCGNSGRSPQPHLHIHVQMTPEIGASTVPFHFCHVLVKESNGQTTYKLNASPAQGEKIKSTSRNAALARALHLTVGRCFDYSVCLPSPETGTTGSTGCNSAADRCRIERLTIKLDLAGQFSIEAVDRETRPGTKAVGKRARALFSVSDDLAAFFDRSGESKLLDVFVLSLGLTPLAEGNLNWQDKVPVRLLPASPVIKLLWSLLHPFSPCIDSFYSRTWDARRRLWIQKGRHSMPICAGLTRSWLTEVQLSELSGVLAIDLADQKGQLLTARLDGWGVKEDNGIPGIMQQQQVGKL
jgi:urea transporter